MKRTTVLLAAPHRAICGAFHAPYSLIAQYGAGAIVALTLITPPWRKRSNTLKKMVLFSVEAPAHNGQAAILNPGSCEKTRQGPSRGKGVVRC